MHYAGTGEVVKAHSVKPSTTPLPASRDGIGNTHEDRREDHEGRELNPLSHCSRHDGGGGGSKHGLEDKVGPAGLAEAGSTVRHVGIGLWTATDRRAQSENAGDGPIPGIHRVEAPNRVKKDS